MIHNTSLALPAMPASWHSHEPSVARSLDDNIRAVGVNPGPVNSDRIYKILKNRAKSELGDEDQYAELLKRYPLGRPAHIYEVSSLIDFLASYRSGYSSGAIFTVDGGIASRCSII